MLHQPSLFDAAPAPVRDGPPCARCGHGQWLPKNFRSILESKSEGDDNRSAINAGSPVDSRSNEAFGVILLARMSPARGRSALRSKHRC